MNRKEYYKAYRLQNKDKKKEYGRIWREKHKIKPRSSIKLTPSEYQQKKKAQNPLYKLSANIRTRISQTLTGYSKSKSTLEILNVETFEHFKIYLESLFQENMNWDDYGFGENKWVIDHKIPIAEAKNEEEIYKLNHYTNLQPLWWRENLDKSDKLLYL